MSVLTDLSSSRELLLNLTQREIKGKYKRTALGQLWSLLNPIAVIATYSVVFAFLLRAQPLPGNPSGLHVFAIWLACALLPWMYFNAVLTTGMGSLVANANLIQKVWFPRETLVVANTLSWLFTHSVEMVVLVVAILIFGGNPLIYLPGVFFFMIMLTLLGLGFAFLLSVANVYFRDTQHFVAIFMQLWFYATPIVYTVTQVSRDHPGFVKIYRLNPLERYTEAFRNLLYDNRWPSLVNTIYITVVSLVVLVIGYLVFKKYESRLAEEL